MRVKIAPRILKFSFSRNIKVELNCLRVKYFFVRSFFLFLNQIFKIEK